MTKRILIVTLTIFAAALIYGCSSKTDGSDSGERPRATVEVAPADLGNIDEAVSTTGSFQVLRDEKIKSTTAGKVEKVFVLEGDAVRKGEVLATILSQESNAAITGAMQLLDQAKSPEEKRRAEESLRLAERTAAVAKITAPFSGAVIHRFVTEGELVNQGSDLVEMIDPETEYFIANVPVSDVASVRAGESAVVTVPNMDLKPIRGTVEAVNPSTDPNSQSLEVRIGFGAIPAAVTAGTFGNIVIRTGEKRGVILVPKDAVYHDDELDQDFVWRIQGDSLALLTRVRVGLSDSSRVEIVSGIRRGDTITTVGGYGLPDSTLVTIATH
jgi:RND family efflux transporter MFP subunit